MKSYIFMCFVLCLLFSSCSGGSGSSNTTGNTGGTNTAGNDTAGDSGTGTDTADTTDDVDNTSFDSVVNITFSTGDSTVQTGTGTARTVTADGITVATGINVAKTTYGITITSTYAAAVKYTLTGTLNGTLTVNSTNEYQLYLNDVTINGGTTGPALDLESSAKAFIVTASNTTNTLTDQSTRTGLTGKAAVFGNGIMVFSKDSSGDGDGTLSVTGNYKHGIYSNDYIRICSGIITVSVTAKNAIQSINGFIFDDGTLTINGTGTTLDDESKGIKVEGVEGNTGEVNGYIVINGGNITINSISKAITATWDIDEDASTLSTTDDPTPYVEVNGGVINITTTTTPTDDLSPEGIEGKSGVTISGGTLTINTTDDCINAGEYIIIKGGSIFCKSSNNDSIDSNGTLTIAGGLVVSIGSQAPEGPFDCDTNTFKVTGGTFVGIGGTTSGPTASECTQNVVVLGSISTGTMAVVSESGTVVFAYTIPQSYSTMILSSPDIITGTKYTVYKGVTASGDNLFNGLYTDNLSCTNGSKTGTSFTVSSSVTQSGGTIFH